MILVLGLFVVAVLSMGIGIIFGYLLGQKS